MKGSRCRCGYATTALKRICPRCGKVMKPAEWPDDGQVVSFSKLDVIPEGLTEPFNIALVSVVNKGPKVICWVPGTVKVGQEVAISEDAGKYFCNPKKKRPAERT